MVKTSQFRLSRSVRWGNHNTHDASLLKKHNAEMFARGLELKKNTRTVKGLMRIDKFYDDLGFTRADLRWLGKEEEKLPDLLQLHHR